MNIDDLLNEESIILGSHAKDKNEVIDILVSKHFECGHIDNKDHYKEAILKRESLSSTGVGNMIAIPHAQDETVKYPSLVAMVDQEGVDYDSLDQQPAKLFFMIAVPKDGGSQHLEILAQLSQILMDESIVDLLINAKTPQDFLNILTGEMNEVVQEEIHEKVDIVAVTACPTGIAHTYMAAKSLEDKAKEMNVVIKVETNGASGVKNKLTSEDIQNAKCVIVAADKKVDMNRFDGKHLIQVPVADGIHHADYLIKKAMQQDADVFEGHQEITIKNDKGIIRRFYKHLMNGISQVIPILMIFGIFVSVIQLIQNLNLSSSYISFFYPIASMAITFSMPILSAFIADSISEKPGFVVALVSSAFVMNLGGHILECIIIGFLAGYIVLGLSYVFSKMPENFQSVIPNLLLPIIGTLIVCFGVYLVSPYFFNYIDILTGELSMPVNIIIGFILGLMMSIDMGGPVNKTAYTIGIIGIFIGRYDLMAAVMIGGMIPPLVIWLTMLFSPSSFSEEERKGKWKCLIKGLCFVSEEAIPYMTKDKKGVHIPCIIASGIAGGLSMLFNCGQAFPHGGIWTIFFIEQPQFFIISLFAATLFGMSMMLLLKKTSEE